MIEPELFRGEFESPDRCVNPSRDGLRYSGYVVVLLVGPALGIASKYGSELTGAWWGSFAAVSVALCAACFAFTLLASRIGRRRANRWMCAFVGVLLVFGMLMLVRHLGT